MVCVFVVFNNHLLNKKNSGRTGMVSLSVIFNSQLFNIKAGGRNGISFRGRLFFSGLSPVLCRIIYVFFILKCRFILNAGYIP